MSETTDYMKYAVLYVDDEEQALKYFRRGFDKQFKILTANNVDQAMVILEADANSVGVVITDQRMPGRSGVELLSELKRRWPAISRVLITAYTEIDDAVAAVNTGAVYKYVNKPADFALIKQVLTDALDLHRQTIERDALAQTLKELELQRQATQAAETQREELQQRLLNASRDAGRAEVATGILHNVGNVLNSMNVSAAMVNKTLHESKVSNLNKALAMLQEHSDDLSTFLTADDRGRVLPGYLSKLAGVLAQEQNTLIAEVASLRQSLEHIGHVVQMQQAYAKASSVKEKVDPDSLIEDAVRMNRSSIDRHGVKMNNEPGGAAPVLIDKHRVLQILINLISNATNSLAACPPESRNINTRICVDPGGEFPQIRFQIIDTGSGILPENLTKIFNHGFTTRQEGHGFGLHSSANAAREMGGSLTASSEGAGRGAVFTLELPVSSDQAPNVPAELIEKVSV